MTSSHIPREEIGEVGRLKDINLPRLSPSDKEFFSRTRISLNKENQNDFHHEAPFFCFLILTCGRECSSNSSLSRWATPSYHNKASELEFTSWFSPQLSH